MELTLSHTDEHQTMPKGWLPLPTFLVIGAQKCGTRWLRVNLGAHPEIFTVPHEVKYFNHTKRVSSLGSDWYRAQFAGWSGEPVAGEATPGYLIWRHRPGDVAARIKATLPDARLIAVLRNPIERAYSALLHHKRRGRIHPSVRLIDHVRSVPPEDDWMCVVTGGWYAASLRPYLRLFGDRVLVLLLDDLRVDAGKVYEQALRHVGASPRFVPPALHDVVGTNRDGTEGHDLDMTPAEQGELFDYFRADVEQLEELLDRDLSAWGPAAA